MVKRISLVSAAVLVLVAANTASAITITWFGSGQVEQILTPANRFIGLDVGTPWTLAFEVNPDAPVSFSNGGGCNGYFSAIGASTLTLGPYTYTANGGTIYTEHDFPGGGCNVGPLDGHVQFLLAPLESDDPDAWPLEFETLFVSYFDAIATDGTIPLAPTYLPGSNGARVFTFSMGTYWQRLGPARFEVLDEQPAPVPEPATMTMFGAGLAALIARRRQRRH